VDWCDASLVTSTKTRCVTQDHVMWLACSCAFLIGNPNSSPKISSMDSADRPHKSHRPAHSGGKADKKGKSKHGTGFNEKVSHFSEL
jgi:hypothetical protein